MNILMMTNTYAPFVGGLEKSIQTFTKEFRERGHKVMVVTPEMPGAKKEYGVLRIPAIQKFSGTDFSVNLPIPGLVERLMDKFKPDIVHAHHPFLVGDMAVRLAGQYKIPLIFTYHTMWDQYSYNPMGDEMMKKFLTELAVNFSNLSDQVIAPSESVRDVIKERGVTAPISVVPTGLDVARFATGSGRGIRKEFRIPPGAHVIGHIGRLSPEKNLDFVTTGVIEHLKRDSDAHFLVVGKGPSQKDIRQLFVKEGLKKRLHFAGVRRGKDLVNAYHAMDVFAFASESETQGMVITEAMAAGLPVVALDASGVREVVQDGKNGRLLAVHSEHLFGEALGWCLQKKNHEKLKKAAVRTAKLFSIERTADKALRVYRAARARKREEGFDQSSWHLLMNRLSTEWHLFASTAKATGKAIVETVTQTPPKSPN